MTSETATTPREMAGQMEQIFGNRTGFQLWQLSRLCRNSKARRFDVTFYDRKPILEVTLDKGYVRDYALH